MFKQIAQFLFDMFLPLVVGYLMRRMSKVSPKLFDTLIVLNITSIFPLLSLFSLWGVHLNPQYLWLPFLGVFQQLIPGLAGYLLGGKRLTSPDEKGSFVISGLLSNRATMGALSVFILLGVQAYALAQLVVIFEPLVTFAVAFPLAQHYQRLSNGEEGNKFKLGDLFNRNMIPLVAVMIGLVLNYSGLPRPAFGGNVFPYLIHLNGWSALLPVGYSINFSGIRKQLKPAWGLAGIKFLVAPAATLLLLYPFMHEMLVVKVLLILSFAPAAIFSVLAAKIYKLHVNLTVAAFVLTTALFLGIIYPSLAVVLYLFPM